MRGGISGTFDATLPRLRGVQPNTFYLHREEFELRFNLRGQHRSHARFSTRRRHPLS